MQIPQQKHRARGFTILELLIVIAIIFVVASMAAPNVRSVLRSISVGADARGIAETVALTKMRAAAEFTQTRIYADLSTNSYRVELFDKTSLKCCWVKDTKGNSNANYLSSGVTFGFGSLSTPPTGQSSVAWSKCADPTDNTQPPINNTSCIVFNSRGTPIDTTGNPFAAALYINNGATYYATSVYANGFIQNYQNVGGSNWNKL